MAIANNHKKTRRWSSLFDFLRPEQPLEKCCPECGRPYLEHPERAPTHRFHNRDVELFIYEQHRRGRKSFWLRVGVWRATNDGFRLHQILDQHEAEALLDVVGKAVEFMNAVDVENRERSSASKDNSWVVRTNK
jgi:hypothetical protein